MTRPNGLGVVDHDPAFLDDPKVLDALEAGGPAAVLGYVLVRDASWREGDRLRFRDAVRAAPYAVVLALGDVTDVLRTLVDCELLDDDGRIPVGPWASWFEAARERVTARQEAGRRAGIASGITRRRTTVERPLNDRSRSDERSLNPSLAEPSSAPYRSGGSARPSRAHTRATPASPPAAASPPTSLPTDTDDDLDDEVLEREVLDDDTDGTGYVASWPATAAGDGRDDTETTRRADRDTPAVLGRPSRSYAELLEHAEPGSFLASVAERRRRAVAGSP
jgi:hypothetical protein